MSVRATRSRGIFRLWTALVGGVILAGTVGAPAMARPQDSAPPCSPAPFTDVAANNPFCLDIEWMKDTGISTGFDDGTYRPDIAVSRQAMSAFIARLARAPLSACAEEPFSDVATDHPFCREIRWMKNAEISTGFGDGTYRPALVVTRQAMSAFLARLIGATLDPCDVEPFDDVPTDHPFCREIQWMKATGVSTGFDDGTYRPAATVTRQAMSAFMRRTYVLMRPPPPTELVGDADAPATETIPTLDFQFDADDYAPNPSMGGLVVSFDTLYLVFELGTSVADANALLAEIGAGIIGGRPGVEAQFEGILYVRVPTHSHAEMDALLEQLNADPRVRVAVQDSMLEPFEVSETTGDPNLWSWGSQPFGDNWGLEAVRVPQMWNLNKSLEKAGKTTYTGVLDGGFYDHRDLYYDTKFTALGVGPEVDHGTHVAGTIAAGYNNHLGVDGVTPYARLVVDKYSDKGGWGLYEFIEKSPDLEVVNVSLGENWYQHPPTTDGEALKSRLMIAAQAEVFELWQKWMVSNGRRLPLIVAAAGNDSNSPAFSRDIGAEWSSPWNYAAIVDGVDNVIVVEAVRLVADGSQSRASFSNINGQISAPGVDICSTAPPRLRNPFGNDPSCGGETINAPYMLMSGTSMAAPHVTGLASYLLSLDGSLTPQELRKLLIENGVTVAGTPSPRIDAFASALAIDGLRNNSVVLKRLLDIDDGTVDGNLRLDCTSVCTEFTGEDADVDGGRGDGKIDMSDFRRWRDWQLIVTDDPGLVLDGSSHNPKTDVNHDNFFTLGAFEDVYPDGDFNGDGTLDLTKTNFLPGFVNSSVTDLEALQSMFDDPDYSASQLDGLIESVDIHVDASACLGDGIVGVQTKIFETADMYWVDDRYDTTPASHEFTEPYRSGGYTVRVEAFDDAGNTAAVAQASFAAPLGSDSWFKPTACGRITLDPTSVSVTMNKGQTTKKTVTLTSASLAADWEFSSAVDHVAPSIDGGSIGAGGSVAVELTLTCPATAGNYGGYLNLKFTGTGGGTITKAVPEYLPVDLRCLAGTVVLGSPTMEITGRPGTTITQTFTLTNNGTPLRWVATPGDRLSIEDQAEAEGELGQLSSQSITVTAECPEEVGEFETSLALHFERDGEPVTVDVPEDLPVTLTCKWTAPFAFVDQLHSNHISLDWPYQHVLNRFHSNPALGTGTFTNQEQHDPEVNTEVAWDGWGTQFSAINLSDSYDFCNGCADPQTRTRSASSSRHFDATLSGPTPTVTLTGDMSQQYTQSRKLPIDNHDFVTTDTSIKFDLSAGAEVDASWTCAGTCIVALHGCDSCGWIFLGNESGTFTGTLSPGRYLLFVSSSLPISGDALSVSRQASYSVELTFPE